ncbi:MULTISPECIES: PLP-dependent cysteine synthase family protein [Dethiosulfovibrio]|uniref:Cysteine synthase family protein n=2 Tax=Dethiosulfovibrio TaxID=47054 RepID=A0ABS9EMJ8_9BACT|nr:MULTISPECIES: cysteine synthase family protein [Dethiosulfovibrio]MCF4114901.1 cysteine synthase family protein [Dethiosulfovibrio russensis]MCF4142422.1 cysteine synthase family protein [Dethiosulfovibrio marinus]MCF4145393.1 cysteine synthase family protein [Dethiosulfovibrio acidaminovorans]
MTSEVKKLIENIYEAIGETPLLRLKRIVKHYDVEGDIYAKLEYLNPGYSKKDRPALQMIEEAERSGELKPGQTVVELTSGNTGTGLALVCGAKGHPFVAVMSEGNSPERARMMRALGAEVVLVPQSEGAVEGQVSGRDLELVERRTGALVMEREAFRADQFRLDSSYRAHLENTAVEMWEQSDGRIDCFVDLVGSGGTFEGCAEKLKSYRSDIRCYVAEPAAAAVYAGCPLSNGGRHRIQGCGYAMDLPKIKRKHIDGCVQVTDEDACRTTRDLARLEGCFVGISSGANVWAAIQLLRGKERGGTIALTLNDSGLKYLSSDLFP